MCVCVRLCACLGLGVHSRVAPRLILIFLFLFIGMVWGDQERKMLAVLLSLLVSSPCGWGAGSRLVMHSRDEMTALPLPWSLLGTPLGCGSAHPALAVPSLPALTGEQASCLEVPVCSALGTWWPFPAGQAGGCPLGHGLPVLFAGRRGG